VSKSPIEAMSAPIKKVNHVVCGSPTSTIKGSASNFTSRTLYAFASVLSTLAEHARRFAIDLQAFGAYTRREDLLSPQDVRAVSRGQSPVAGDRAQPGVAGSSC
jgi:hypothetical protein